MNKGKMIDLFIDNIDYESAISIGKRLVEKKFAGVSYIIKSRCYFPTENDISINDNSMMILKTFDLVMPKIKEEFLNKSYAWIVALPPVDVADDYSNWISQEVVR